MKTSRRKTALIITPRYLPLLGGMERECALLAGAFDRSGFRTVVVTEQLDPALPRSEEMGPAKVVRIPSSAKRTLSTQLLVATRLTAFLLSHRRDVAFAVVRTFTLPALVVGLMKKLRLIRYPTLITAETGGVEDDVVMLQQRPLSQVSRSLVSSHDVINGICMANVEHMREFGLPESKITSIPNGIDISPWRSTRPPERVRRFLFLGRIEESKGVFELMEAFRGLQETCPDVTLSLAGTGSAAEELQADNANSGVKMLGMVDYDELDRLFTSHDCLVLPSHSEGMPLSVLEAAARHRVLVLSDVGDLGVRFGDSAFMCEPASAASLLEALRAATSEAKPSTPYEQVIEEVDINTVAEAMISRLFSAA